MIGKGLASIIGILSSNKSKSANFTSRDVINPIIQKFYVEMGERPKGRFNRIPHNHILRQVELCNTETDNLENDKVKLDLISTAGPNRKCIDLFNYNTYLSIKDLKGFCQSQRVVEDNLKAKKSKRKKPLANKVNESLIKTYENAVNRERAYAAIQSHKTKLTIVNDMPCYETFIKVHICSHRNFENCENIKGATTTDELTEKLKETFDLDTNFTKRTLKKDEVILEDSTNNPFKNSLILKEASNIRRLDAFNERVAVLKTITMRLKPSDIGIIYLRHNYPLGIDLFSLENCKSTEASSHTFFIVESVGSIGLMNETANPVLKHKITTPVHLRYALKHEIKYIAPQDEDMPLVLKAVEETNQFEDFALWDEFHKSRGSKISASYTDINIDNRNPQAKYTLEMHKPTLISESALINLQEAIQKTGKDLDLDRIQEMMDQGIDADTIEDEFDPDAEMQSRKENDDL